MADLVVHITVAELFAAMAERLRQVTTNKQLLLSIEM
jgi:hypothetical protein